MTRLTHMFCLIAVAVSLSFGTATGARAAESLSHFNDRLTALLLTAEDGVAPDAGTVSAGLFLDLAKGWKTYWRSPGEVGYPPTINWAGSTNIAGADFFWPTPDRFVAFGVENYGYGGQVTFPLQVRLKEPGLAAHLVAEVSLLTCAEICVPETFTLDVALPAGSGIDQGSADEIARAVGRVPGTGAALGLDLTSASLTDDTLSLGLTRDAGFVRDPDVFPDLGEDGAFGAPSYRYGVDGKSVQVSLPVLSMPEPPPPLRVVVKTAAGAAEFEPVIAATAPPPAAAVPGVLLIIGLAFLGGLILNVMPCVLPVLSIKITSAMTMRDASPGRVRAGFLASAAGVLTFMLGLALVLIAVRAAGGSIGWGVQFQSPVFLALMISVVTLFAANLAGLFEISLPQGIATRLSDADGRPGLLGDFGTGALAAVLATPCSAPFLGTAVAVALAGAAPLTLTIFAALGLGLALPYILVAIRPSLISALPRPGRWMQGLKLALAALLLGTALWLLWVFTSVAGTLASLVVVALLVTALFAVAMRGALGTGVSGLIATLAVVTAIGLPGLLPQAAVATATVTEDPVWGVWSRPAVAAYVSGGETVFVDVTADWCLTCKTNKALVLDRDPVAGALASDRVMALQADWTRPDPEILAYLQENGRFGIPFNMVYGPNAPDGIALPELLTTEAVLDAIAQAAN